MKISMIMLFLMGATTLSITTLRIVGIFPTLTINNTQHLTLRITVLSGILLSVVMLSVVFNLLLCVIMLNVIMLNVIMLSVVAHLVTY